MLFHVAVASVKRSLVINIAMVENHNKQVAGSDGREYMQMFLCASLSSPLPQP